LVGTAEGDLLDVASDDKTRGGRGAASLGGSTAGASS